MLAHPHKTTSGLYYIRERGIWYAVSKHPFLEEVWHYWASCDNRDENGRPEWAEDEQREIDFSWENGEELMGFGLREAK